MKLYFVLIATYCIVNEQQSLSKANLSIHVILRCIILKRELLKTTILNVSWAGAENILKSIYRKYSILWLCTPNMLVFAANYHLRIWLIKKNTHFYIKKNSFFYNSKKNISPILTMVVGCNQDNIIYNCAKLHDHSSNRKWDILCAAHALFLDVRWEVHILPNTLEKKINFFHYLWAHFIYLYIT